jgi:hypothetical protein
MTQIESGGQMSFSLSAKNWAQNEEQSVLRSAQFSASCRRSGCSPTVPYPPHECFHFTTFFDPPFPMGTSLLCKTGDISTLH